MKLVNIVDLKSTAVRLPGSNPGEGTIFPLTRLITIKINIQYA